MPAPVVTWRGDPPVEIGDIVLESLPRDKRKQVITAQAQAEWDWGVGRNCKMWLHTSLYQPPMSSGVFILVKCWVYQRDLVMPWKQMTLKSQCPKAVVLISSSHHTCSTGVTAGSALKQHHQHLSWQSRHHQEQCRLLEGRRTVAGCSLVLQTLPGNNTRSFCSHFIGQLSHGHAKLLQTCLYNPPRPEGRVGNVWQTALRAKTLTLRAVVPNLFVHQAPILWKTIFYRPGMRDIKRLWDVTIIISFLPPHHYIAIFFNESTLHRRGWPE